jgi:hypothetical protein
MDARVRARYGKAKRVLGSRAVKGGLPTQATCASPLPPLLTAYAAPSSQQQQRQKGFFERGGRVVFGGGVCVVRFPKCATWFHMLCLEDAERLLGAHRAGLRRALDLEDVEADSLGEGAARKEEGEGEEGG